MTKEILIKELPFNYYLFSLSLNGNTCDISIGLTMGTNMYVFLEDPTYSFVAPFCLSYGDACYFALESKY